MASIKRIVCKKCKAHILGDQPFCSVCLEPRPRGLLNFENLFLIFIILWGAAITYWFNLLHLQN